MFRRIGRIAVALTGAMLLSSALLGAVTVGAASATGQANWQITFAGTTGGFGFWGWCDLSDGTTFSSGLATSGTSGDCSFAEYVHEPGVFSGTCEQNLDLTGWQEQYSSFTGVDDWFVSGTSVTHPASETAFCESLLGAFQPTFTDADSILPVLVGHANLTAGSGLTEYQITETPAR